MLWRSSTKVPAPATTPAGFCFPLQTATGSATNSAHCTFACCAGYGSQTPAGRSLGPTAEKAVPDLPVSGPTRFPTRSKVPLLVSGLLSDRTSDPRDHNAHTPYGSRGLVRQVVRVMTSHGCTMTAMGTGLAPAISPPKPAAGGLFSGGNPALG
jgi:hypothetical protein